MSRETLGYRIRDAEVHKVPYMAVIGERERRRGPWRCGGGGRGKKQEVRDRGEFVGELVEEVGSRAL